MAEEETCPVLLKNGVACDRPVWRTKKGRVGTTCWVHSDDRRNIIEGRESRTLVETIVRNVEEVEKAVDIDTYKRAKAISGLTHEYVNLCNYILDRHKADEFASQLLKFDQRRAKMMENVLKRESS
jgi:hypothetical protein